MRSPNIFSSALLLIPLTLAAQQLPTTLQQAPQQGAQPEFVNLAAGAGLQTDDPERLLGNGTDYLARFSRAGLRFIPALGLAAKETRHVSLRPTQLRRGEHVLRNGFESPPAGEARRVQYQHCETMQERYDVRENGVEVSWQFAERPIGTGDLVVRYEVETNLPYAGRRDGGLQFVQDELGGVSIGSVTGVDACGERVAGALSYADGVLEMSLPAAFVDSATYPIVLDPLVGSVIQVTPNTIAVDEPDASYDATWQRYLVAWRQTLSSTLVVARARLTDSGGIPIGPVSILSASGVCGRPRIANHSFSDRFGVVFEEQAGAFHGIQFRAVSSFDGLITHSAVLASSTGVNLFRDPDVGGNGNTSNSHAFVAVWEDNITNSIRARRIYFNAADALVAPSPINLFTDSSGPASSNSYTQPAISRQASTGLTFMVVARRLSGIGPSRIISGKLISSTTLATISSTSLELTATDNLTSPDVDGADGTWIVAWERHLGTSATTRIERRATRYDGSGWTLEPVLSLGSTLLDVEAPSIGYSQARTWLGYHRFSGIGGQLSLRVSSLDTATASTCASEFSQTIASADQRIVVATDFTGAVNGGSNAIAVFAHGTKLYAQMLINYGTSGTYSNVGGQCGSGGSQSFSHAPGIGSTLVCGVNGLNPTSLLTVFNLTTDMTPVVCGTCNWAPFAVTSSQIPVGGTAATSFPIPCLPTLVGSQFITQWTTLDPTQTACTIAPEFVMTDRSLMTIGN